MTSRELNVLAYRAREGDLAALDALVGYTWPRLDRYLAARYPSLRGETAAPTREDLLQETWIGLVEAGGALEKFDAGQSDLWTWLKAVLQHKVSGYFRRQNSQKRQPERLHTDAPEFAEFRLEDRSPDPEHTVSTRDLLVVIRECLKRTLSPESWLIALMRYWDDMEVNEIAGALNLKEARIYKRLPAIQRQAVECRDGAHPE